MGLHFAFLSKLRFNIPVLMGQLETVHNYHPRSVGATETGYPRCVLMIGLMEISNVLMFCLVLFISPQSFG